MSQAFCTSKCLSRLLCPALLLALFGALCAGVPPQVAHAQAPSPKGSASKSSRPENQARGPRPFIMIPPSGMKVVKRPPGVACALETNEYESPPGYRSYFPLLAAPGAQPFATVTAGAVRILIPAGDPRAPLVVEAERNGFFLRGILGKEPKPVRGPGPNALIVYPAEAFALGGFYWPGKEALLSLTRHPTRGFAVSPVSTLPREVEPAPGVLPAPVPCKSISLDPASKDIVPPLPGGKPRTIQLAPGALLPLLDQPFGKRRATIRIGKAGSVDMKVYPPSKGHVLLVWHLQYGTIMGYVLERLMSRVEQPPGELGLGYGGSLGSLMGSSRSEWRPYRRLVCEDDVLVAVDVPAPPRSKRPPDRVVVGGFRAGTVIPIQSMGAKTATLHPLGLPFSVSSSPSLRPFIPAFLLGACKPN